MRCNVTAGNQVWDATLALEDSTEMMLMDGRRAYETIDMLTSQYNNRWCASAGPGGADASCSLIALTNPEPNQARSRESNLRRPSEQQEVRTLRRQ